MTPRRPSRPPASAPAPLPAPKRCLPRWFWQARFPLLLFVLVLLPFLTTLRNQFISLDDPDYVTSNAVVQGGITWQGMGWAFGWHAANWHPLTWFSHMADCQIYGMEAWGHHLTSAVLHALNAALLFLVLRRLTGAWAPSFFAAACFGTHPLRVESVAWVAERKDVLSMSFFLLTLWAYARFAEARKPAPGRNVPPGESGRRHGARFYVLAVLFFALGLMSKPMLVSVPFVLLLLDYWPLQRHKSFGWSSLAIEKVPFILLAAASCAATVIAQKMGGAMTDAVMKLRVENALIAYVRYLGKLVYPPHLGVFYPRPGSWPWAAVVVAALFLVAISLVVIVLRRAYPYLAVGWFWFLGTLIPVIGLVEVGAQSIADRYTYLPSIGFVVLAAWGVCDLTKRWRWGRPFRFAGGTLVVALCVALTFRQVTFWHDSERLYRHTIAVTGENFLASKALGNALHQAGRLDEAAACFKEALRLAPHFAAAHGAYSLLLSQQGQAEEAFRHGQTALGLRPNDPMLHGYMGLILARQNRFDEAILEYRTAIRLGLGSASVYQGLARALLEKGHFPEAVDAAREAVRLEPGQVRAHYDLALALVRASRVDEALVQFQEALRLQPDLYEVRNDLGLTLAGKGRWEDAVSQYELAIKAKPDFASARKNLGRALAALGRLDQAAQNFQAALKLSPEDGESHSELGAALARMGRLDEAITQLTEAVRLQPREARAYHLLGCALAEKGRLEEAIVRLRQGLDIQPDLAGASADLGRALGLQGHLAEAIQRLRIAVQLDPRNAETRNLLGATLAESGDLDQAIPEFREAAELNPNFMEARANLTNALAAKARSSKP